MEILGFIGTLAVPVTVTLVSLGAATVVQRWVARRQKVEAQRLGVSPEQLQLDRTRGEVVEMLQAQVTLLEGRLKAKSEALDRSRAAETATEAENVKLSKKLAQLILDRTPTEHP